MKFCCIILSIVFCLITVEGRNFHQQNINTDLNENVDIKQLRNKPERRMRNRRQSYYNNHLNPYQNSAVGDFLKDILFSVREIETQIKQGVINRYNPAYYDYRPNYSNTCEDTLKELLTLYKELALQVKYSPPPPPPPPQIIYVQYPVPATCNQKVDKTPSGFNITTRVPPKDPNRIWMDIPKGTGTEDDDDGKRPVSFRPKQPMYIPKDTGTEDDEDGKRPVSFKPNQPKRPQITPPPFDHGSAQAGTQPTTPPTLKLPGTCEAAILSCCGLKTEEEQEKCFDYYKCPKSYKTGVACSPDIIMSVLDNFSKMYGPVNEL